MEEDKEIVCHHCEKATDDDIIINYSSNDFQIIYCEICGREYDDI